MTGGELSHYQILEKLGEGGMGVVYKARDTLLDRFVALKILPKERGESSFRRFVQEAKAASALNHPNIITIHEISSSDGTDFMVMELVNGQTLAQLISLKVLTLKETLRYAVQTADAVAAAHAAGITHRDLKPGNVMVTDKGLIKVLDFGLAKQVEASVPQESTATLSIRPDAPLTQEGMILGTVAYMSPEQAEGKKVDGRSDIFSFGVMLYEMLTGQQPFSGGTNISTLAAILTQDPKPISEIMPTVPRDLERILMRCLKKDPEWRFQHMDDVKVALAELQQEVVSGELPRETPPQIATRRRFAGIALGAGLAAGTGVVTWWLRTAHAPAPRRILTQLTRDTGLTTDPALSPDAKLIAYASDRAGEDHLDIWVQQVSDGSAIRLTSGASEDTQPQFSPDGARIVFRSTRDGGGLFFIPALGGEPAKVTSGGGFARFSPDGNWIAYSLLEDVYVVPISHGTPAKLQPDFTSFDFKAGVIMSTPVWESYGRHLLFVARPRDTVGGTTAWDWWVSSFDVGSDGSPRLGKPASVGVEKKLQARRMLTFWPNAWMNGGVYFAAAEGDSASLWRLSINPRTFRAGALEQMVSGIGYVESPSVSRDGRIAFASLDTTWELWSMPVDTNLGEKRGNPSKIRSGRTVDAYPSLSMGSNKLVFSSLHGTQWDVWLRDLGTGQESCLADTSLDETNPIISADGSRVAYQTSRGQQVMFYMVPASGGAPQKIYEGSGRIHLSQWAPDGENLLIERYSRTKVVELLSLRTGQAVEIARHSEDDLYQPVFSPDEKWIAANLANHGRQYVCVIPLRDGKAAPQSEWIRASDGNFDIKPRWSPDGNTIYFLSNRGGVQSLRGQRLDGSTKRPAGASFDLVQFSSARLSPFNMAIEYREIGVNRERIVVSMGNRTGNIWTLATGGQEKVTS